MRRMILLLALLMLPAVPAYAQPALSARVTQVDSSHYPDVTLYVSVTDAAGRPAGGLAASDFSISEDGQRVDLSSFVGGGASPVATALLIDRSASMEDRDKIGDAQDAARAFVGQMRPGDRTALIAFSSRPQTIQEFTADQSDLVEAIGRVRPDGGTAIYDSVIAGVDALKGSAGRRALLLLTDGQDCRDSNSCPDQYGSRSSLDQAIDYANRQGQPLYVVGLGDRGSDDRDGVDEAVLQRLAQATGGEYFYAPTGDQLAGLYRKLSADLQQEYALTYRSPRPFYDGTRRDIRVSVSGAPAASGRYVEHHLIDVRSDPLVGLLLLIPILGALLLPSLRHKRLPVDPAPSAAQESPAASPPATGSTIVPPYPVVLPPDLPRCTSCDAPLLRAGARFCAECGAAQPAADTSAKRAFCDQCGRPLRAGARFCTNCGATAAPAGALISDVHPAR